jgi:quercetin dioxygenase-like cupin family protein
MSTPERPDANHLSPDGSLRMQRWAEHPSSGSFRYEVMGLGWPRLFISLEPRPVQMAQSDATAEPLLTNGTFGADILRFPEGGSVVPHSHPGDHLLFVLSGQGRLGHQGNVYELRPGLCYLVPGADVHSIYADTILVLLSIANDHRPAGSESRLDLAQEAPIP